MSQRINHRREGKRHQDNGPTWESKNPMKGCNSTHVARARSQWRKLGRRAERRTGQRCRSVHYLGKFGKGSLLPSMEQED